MALTSMKSFVITHIKFVLLSFLEKSDSCSTVLVYYNFGNYTKICTKLFKIFVYITTYFSKIVHF